MEILQARSIRITPIAPRCRKSTGGKVAFGASSRCESDPKRFVTARLFHFAAFMISASQLHVRLRSIRRSIMDLRRELAAAEARVLVGSAGAAGDAEFLFLSIRRRLRDREAIRREVIEICARAAALDF
jgi:hypothetical protein